MKRRIAAILALTGMAAVVVAAASLAASGRKQTVPGAVLDQSNPQRPPACLYVGWALDDGNSYAAQTFTAGMNGQLTDVVLPALGGIGGFSLSLTPVFPTGLPDIDHPIATANTTFAPVTRPYPSPYPEVDVTFSTKPVLKAGTQYGLVMSNPSANGLANDSSKLLVWAGDLSSQTVDRNSHPCADGAYGGGRGWAKGTDLPQENSDFFFSTYMIPLKRVTVSKTGSGVGIVSGTGIDCGTGCTTDLAANSQVSLTATPNPGSVFTGWSGACSGATRTCSFPLTADATVTASFARLYRLTVRHSQFGTVITRPAGISCGAKCVANFRPGIVTLIARPSTGHTFVRWAGAAKSTARIVHLRLTRASVVIPIFK